MKGIVLLTGILAAALLATACGDGSDEPLTPPAYFQSLGIVMTDTANEIAFLNEPENRDAWFKDLNATRELLDRSVGVGQAARAKLQRLNPPPELESLHNRMVVPFGTLVDANVELQQALAGMTTNEEMSTFQAENMPLPGVPDAANAFRTACKDMQDAAAGQNLGVNLHCDEV